MTEDRTSVLNNPAVRAILLAIMVIIVSIIAFKSYQNRPIMSDLNGEYYNPCCSKIVIRDGIIFYGGRNIPFSASRMKFGITIYPTVPIGNFYSLTSDGHSRHPNSLIFMDGNPPKGFKILDYRRNEYVFSRAQGIAN